jgi:hypothetical protein
MSLLRASLAVCWLAMSLTAAAAAPVDDWLARSIARDAEHFRACLADLDEKPLEPLTQQRGVEIYRMVYLPSFYPQVSMRVNVWAGGDGRMTRRGVPPYCNGKSRIDQKQVDLSKTEVDELRSLFARSDFWRMPELGDNHQPIEGDNVERIGCSDGATVYIEAVRDGKHRRIVRGCDIWEHSVRDMVALFHRLAREKDPHQDE